MKIKLMNNSKKMLILEYMDPDNQNNYQSNYDHVLSFKLCDNVDPDIYLNMLIDNYKIYSNVNIIGAQNIISILDDIKCKIFSIIPIEILDAYTELKDHNNINEYSKYLYYYYKEKQFDINKILLPNSLYGGIYINDKLDELICNITIQDYFHDISINVKDFNNDFEYNKLNFIIENNYNELNNIEDKVLYLNDLLFFKYCTLRYFCDEVIKRIADYLEY